MLVDLGEVKLGGPHRRGAVRVLLVPGASCALDFIEIFESGRDSMKVYASHTFFI